MVWYSIVIISIVLTADVSATLRYNDPGASASTHVPMPDRSAAVKEIFTAMKGRYIGPNTYFETIKQYVEYYRLPITESDFIKEYMEHNNGINLNCFIRSHNFRVKVSDIQNAVSEGEIEHYKIFNYFMYKASRKLSFEYRVYQNYGTSIVQNQVQSFLNDLNTNKQKKWATLLGRYGRNKSLFITLEGNEKGVVFYSKGETNVEYTFKRAISGANTNLANNTDYIECDSLGDVLKKFLTKIMGCTEDQVKQLYKDVFDNDLRNDMKNYGQSCYPS